MAKGFSIDVVNNEVIVGNIAGYHQNVLSKVAQYIGEGLYAIEGSAKANCPVDTGGLRQSITAVIGGEDIGGKVECMENISPPIGAYVEFGTGENVVIPEGLEDYAMQFFVNGKGHMKAQPFLFPAFFQEQDIILDNIKSIL